MKTSCSSCRKTLLTFIPDTFSRILKFARTASCSFWWLAKNLTWPSRLRSIWIIYVHTASVCLWQKTHLAVVCCILPMQISTARNTKILTQYPLSDYLAGVPLCNQIREFHSPSVGPIFKLLNPGLALEASDVCISCKPWHPCDEPVLGGSYQFLWEKQ